jgi:hypothetical protein
MLVGDSDVGHISMRDCNDPRCSCREMADWDSPGADERWQRQQDDREAAMKRSKRLFGISVDLEAGAYTKAASLCELGDVLDDVEPAHAQGLQTVLEQRGLSLRLELWTAERPQSYRVVSADDAAIASSSEAA